MKRKLLTVVGNILMAIGILFMIGGLLVSVISYLPDLNLSAMYAEGGLGSLFLGAFIWLLGANFSGKQSIEDRYWCIRREEKLRMRRQEKHS